MSNRCQVYICTQACIKDEKAKVQIIVSGLPLAFSDHIEYDEPRSPKEVIRKLKRYYEQSNRKT